MESSATIPDESDEIGEDEGINDDINGEIASSITGGNILSDIGFEVFYHIITLSHYHIST